MFDIGAAGGGKQAFAGELRSIPGAEHLHQFIAVGRENAGGDVPFGPRRRGEFVEIRLRRQGRANAVTRKYDDEFEMGVGGSSLRAGRLCGRKNAEKKRERTGRTGIAAMRREGSA